MRTRPQVESLEERAVPAHHAVTAAIPAHHAAPPATTLAPGITAKVDGQGTLSVTESAAAGAATLSITGGAAGSATVTTTQGSVTTTAAFTGVLAVTVDGSKDKSAAGVNITGPATLTGLTVEGGGSLTVQGVVVNGPTLLDLTGASAAKHGQGSPLGAPPVQVPNPAAGESITLTGDTLNGNLTGILPPGKADTFTATPAAGDDIAQGVVKLNGGGDGTFVAPGATDYLTALGVLSPAPQYATLEGFQFYADPAAGGTGGTCP